MKRDWRQVASDAIRRNDHRNVLAGTVAGVGAAIAIGAMEWFSLESHYPLVIIPFATSIVLVIGSPQVEPAQPRALIGGHLVATLVGLIVVKTAGPGPWTAAFAVGLAIATMHLTRTFHLPAGIDPLIVVFNDLSWSFLVAPVAAGACLLAVFAFAWHKVVQHDTWPARWW